MTLRVLILTLIVFVLTTAGGIAAVHHGETQPGEMVAFGAVGVGGAVDVFLLDTHTHLTHNITRTPVNETPLAWSPDGRTLAYRQIDVNTGGTRLALWSVDGEITTLPRMTGHRQPQWSPRGDGILVTMRYYDDSAGFANEYTNFAYKLPVDGGEPFRLDTDDPESVDYLSEVESRFAGDYDPFQSPYDQRRLEIAEDEGQYWLMRLEGGRSQRLVPISAADRFGFILRWMDSRYVLFLTAEGLRRLDTFDGTMTLLYNGDIIALADYAPR